MSTQTSAIQQYTQKVEANFAALSTDLGELKSDIAAQNAQILALQTQLAPSLSSDDAAALQKLVDDSGALVTSANAILPVPPAAPPAAS
jgi:peptidoglycan hydrolase CwlO-like protein